MTKLQDRSQRWTAGQDQKLRNLWPTGMLVKDMAPLIGRTEKAIGYRAITVLGLPERRTASLDEATPQRRCRACDQVKPIADFYFRVDVQKHMGVCKPCRNEQMSHNGRLRKYHLSRERYEQMLIEQDYKCAICGRPDGEGGRRLQVDHDHQCCAGAQSCGDCIRGLLCESCNAGLGKLGDTYSRLWYALDYLAYHEGVTTFSSRPGSCPERPEPLPCG